MFIVVMNESNLKIDLLYILVLVLCSWNQIFLQETGLQLIRICKVNVDYKLIRICKVNVDYKPVIQSCIVL